VCVCVCVCGCVCVCVCVCLQVSWEAMMSFASETTSLFDTQCVRVCVTVCE